MFCHSGGTVRDDTAPHGIDRMLSLCPLEVLGNAAPLAGLVQLFISHQTYGHKKHKEEADQDIRSLIWRFRQYPVYLVCSLHAMMGGLLGSEGEASRPADVWDLLLKLHSTEPRFACDSKGFPQNR